MMRSNNDLNNIINTGRIDSAFDDGNGDLIAAVTASVPLAKSMEMESYVLLHLARCSKTPILASAAAIVVSNLPQICRYLANLV